MHVTCDVQEATQKTHGIECHVMVDAVLYGVQLDMECWLRTGASIFISE